MSQPQSTGNGPEPEPSGTQSMTAEPVVAEPIVADPLVPEPVVAEPVVAEPVVAEPVVAEPVVAEPVVAEPVVAEPVVAEPVVAEPVADVRARTVDAPAPTGEVLDAGRSAPSWVSPVPAAGAREPDDGRSAAGEDGSDTVQAQPDAPQQGPGPDATFDLGYPGDALTAPDATGPDLPATGPDEVSAAAGAAPSEAAPTPPSRRGVGRLMAGVAAVALAVGLLGGFAGGWAFQQVRQNTLRDGSVSLPVPARVAGTRSADSVAGIARRVLPSVVAIKVTGANEEGTGSGFVIDPAGYILTNNHVVEVAAGGGTITIVYSDGSQNTAKIVGRDASYDLAVVKADTGDRAALPLGDSDSVVVGDTVIAIGAPLGLQGTVTTGIVSALNRPVAAGGGQTQAFINAIQTDAAINPGNSGGPLVDATGEVIGINSAIARAPGTTLGSTAGNIGLGFSIPSNQARRTAQELIRTGHAQHPVIGVLLDRSYTGPGVKVSASSVDGQAPITPAGPADKAGIKAGDLITAFNGRPVTDPDELVVAIRAQSPGDVVTLTIRRAGSDREVRVTLQASSQ
jgi:putative serine protease PepD